MLDVRRLRLLRELARRGTIAAVAEALTFTASAVSQQLAVLEREAGVALLERTGRRVVLTPAGQALVEHADAVLERLEQASAELASAREGLGGPLRIGTFPSAARTIVPAALAELTRAHPRLEPMVEGIDSAKVADALRAGELDVALIHDYDFVPASPDSTVDSLALLEEPMYLAAPEPHGRQDGTTAAATIGEAILPWKDAAWITAVPGTTGHSATVRTCEAAGFVPQIRHHVNDFSAVLAFVAAEQGVALVPQLGAIPPPPGVRLTRLPLHRRSKTAFRRGAVDHPAIAAFVAALRHAVDELGAIGLPRSPRS
jgi:DNA-binding transcriptional LysR family regulator